MRALLMPVGSHGDVLPLLGLGRTLQQRGFEVRALVNPVFASAADAAGVPYRLLGSEEDYLAVQNDPDIRHPTRGLQAVSRTLYQHMDEGYQALLEEFHASSQETILVGTSLAFPVRCLQEVARVPTAMVHLSPSIIRSTLEPPVLTAAGPIPRWLPRPLVKAMWWLADRLMVDPLLARPLNRLRRKLGLAPVSRILDRWWLQADLNLGLFPAWLASPADWPKNLQLTDFPLWDLDSDPHLPARLEDFLAGAQPPVVFTGGTGFATMQSFYRCCIEACQRVGCRGLLLTRHPGNLPTPLPEHIQHFAYAPFSQLLPRAAAVVHHGGIGTLAQGLAAGIPQVVLPQAHDQFDNAYRVQRLGAGLWCRRQNPEALARCLRSLLADKGMGLRYRCLAERAVSGLPMTVDKIIEWVGRRHQ